MTTETIPPKPAGRTLPFTRGAAYIMEGVLQELGPCTTPNKIVKWSKLWQKLRKENSRLITIPGMVAPVDFERSVIIEEGETKEAFQRRIQAHNDAFAAWKEEPIAIVLTEKQYGVAQAALKWVHEHQKDDHCRIKFTQGPDLSLIFELLDLADDDSVASDE